jgi:DUF1365 family protein
MACIDLDDSGSGFQQEMYPLSNLMSLRDQDHYKNNEGTPSGAPNNQSLAQRTLNLVSERTETKFQPSLKTHSIKLLTHLCYYGYCFNPVSFYYLQNRADNVIEAVVAEVSNTPWNEMQCYVLHKDSVDMSKVQSSRRHKERHGTNYLFPKTFHVSPFMDMEHYYDWTFWEFDASKPMDNLAISTSMYKEKQLWFNAFLEMNNLGCHPYMWAWQLISYPMFCMMIQIWIHYEAFWLFLKGVQYVAHPQGSETAASRIIGNMMIPFFVVKGWIDAGLSGRNNKNKSA